MNTLAGIAIAPDTKTSETSAILRTTEGNGALQPAGVKGATIETHGEGLVIHLKLDGGATKEIMLSVEQARSLSLAIITAVNKQERHTQARRATGIPQLQPAMR